jgi:biotin carboxyl carrier protein
VEALVKFKHGDQIHSVARESETGFEVDGVRVEASVSPCGSSRFDGRAGARRTSVFVAREGDRVFAQVGARSYALKVVARRASAADADSDSQGGLEAPMPGRVTRVEVAVGDVVKRGQELIVVEAMKMENGLISPMDGVVKRLTVKVGDMVAPGPALVVIEAAS